jgi:hypothetical protein
MRFSLRLLWLAVAPRRLAILVGIILLPRSVFAGDPAPRIDYSRDIRPILSDNCFACHGPDASSRKAELRLDRKEDAFRDRKGHAVIVAGDVEASELLARIESDDETSRMPPRKSGKSLTGTQVEILKRWIMQGADWKQHWSLLPPERPAIPKVRNPAWLINSIDDFILARLDAEGLKPSPEAAKTTLIRRVTFDLTGLPPTPAEVDAFLADTTSDAYEKEVERLIQSPRYGEHMARFWLDAARYGDTHGLHLDNYREMWPYRDWVIRAFNGNKRFDEFVVEQLAGELLPNPTLDQLIATGFNRCHVTTNEGGSIEEEVYVRNVVDRVETTGTVFLGMTIGCARCHDHKFDPVTQKEFYQLFAYFNSIDGSPLDGNEAKYPPIVSVPSIEQSASMERIQSQIASVGSKRSEEVAKTPYDDRVDATLGEYVQRSDYVWVEDALPPGAKLSAEGGANHAWAFTSGPDYPVYSGTKSAPLTADGLAQFHFIGANPPLKTGPGDTLFAYVFIDPLRLPKEIMLQWHSDDWKHRAYWGENVIDWGKDGTSERSHVGPLPTTGKWVRLEVDAEKVGIKPGTKLTGFSFTQHGGSVTWDRAGIETFTPQDGQKFETLTAWIQSQRVLGGAGLPKDLQDAVKLDRSKRNDAQKKALRTYFVEHGYSKTSPAVDALNAELANLEGERTKLNAQIATTLIYKESKEPKAAFLLDRGEYDRRRDPVNRVLPSFLPPLPPGASNDRLGIAQWLVAPNHPLTARVAVNRFWQQCFGTGLVKTSEDFGAQGEPPSHPELLDWLAVQFRDDGWDVKRFMKRLVMSATYRQSARVTPDRLAKDPANRFLSRGPRFRLDAEMLRDQALFVSGLMVEQQGGPSVKPPQPAGLWEAVGFVGSNTAIFSPDTGAAKVHRRSVYTFWKRTSPPPQMTTFDAPSREACYVRRERTNTPLQALLLMNETQFVEASRSLAERILRDGGSTSEERLRYAFRLVTGRSPNANDLAELSSTLDTLLSTYMSDVDAAKKLIAVGESKPDARRSPSEVAAWTMMGNLLLNLDETVTKG